jgi:uncharacterized protein (DUF2062 family)
MLTWRHLSGRLRTVLELDDPPQRIAIALAVGVFVGCTPFVGVQTLLSLVIALVFRLNRAATVAGTWLNLPWLMPLVYGAAFKVGTLVVPDPDGLRRAWLTYLVEHPGGLRWGDLGALLEHLSIPLLVGTTVVGGVAALVTYAIALPALRAMQRRKWKERERRAA